VLSEVLEVEGYQVTRARDQDQLIAVLRSTLHPLVVLLDVWAIEGGPSFSDEFLIALVTEHSRWERHAYIVTGGDAHFVAPYLSPSAKRFIADYAAASCPCRFRWKHCSRPSRPRLPAPSRRGAEWAPTSGTSHIRQRRVVDTRERGSHDMRACAPRGCPLAVPQRLTRSLGWHRMPSEVVLGGELGLP